MPSSARPSIFAAYAENPKVVKKAFHNVHDAIVALGIGRTKEEPGVRDEGQGVVHDSLCHFSVFEFDFDPEALDLRIAFKELYFYVVGSALKGLYEEKSLSTSEVNDSASPALQINFHRGRESLSNQASSEWVE
jgi:hypothetical protein